MAEDRSKRSEKLRQACQDGFYQYPNSCSHAVWHVIRQYRPDQPYMMANQLVDHMASSPEWQEVQLGELSKVASEGEVVVGGLKEQGHGHVIAVYPGREKPNGGFTYTDRKTGKKLIAAERGVYALAMSTAMGDWPGAKSSGDKTVRDPWPAKKFSKVRFWKYIGPMEDGVTSASSSRPRWDAKKAEAVLQPKSTTTSSIRRRWRLEADSSDTGFHHPDNFTRWQR